VELLDERGPGATSRIAYVECQAAFARTRREGRLTQRQVLAAERNLDQGWVDLMVVELDSSLTEQAGRMAHEHALRAGDAIHLASAVSIAAEDMEGTPFACWDARLWDAASQLGFAMVPSSRPS
jgi:uncharacterized protein